MAAAKSRFSWMHETIRNNIADWRYLPAEDSAVELGVSVERRRVEELPGELDSGEGGPWDPEQEA